MEARPILLNGDMVRAILEGRKTHTRRAVKHQPRLSDIMPNFVFPADKFDSEALYPAGYIYPNAMEEILALSPYGAVGDLLYVRETFGGPLIEEGTSPDDCYLPEFCEYRADGGPSPEWNDSDGEERSGWTPSIHMPRWASRITLEITSVRVERLQDISEADARAEGITDGGCLNCGESEPCGCDNPSPDARDAYIYLWNSIYGNWHENKWVWVIEFKPHMINVDQYLQGDEHPSAIEQGSDNG